MDTLKQLASSLCDWLWNRLPLILGLAIGIIIVISVGRELYHMEWAGLGEHPKPQSEILPAKTLWDWLDLLVIPLIVALGAALLNSTLRRVESERAEREAQTDREIADDRAKEQALQAYFDTMTELLLKEHLREKLKNDERDAAVVDIARMRTVTVLRKLDRGRKEEVLDFLGDAELYKGSNALLQCAKMDRIMLPSVGLREINLSEARLNEADLSGASLWKAVLTDVYLNHANLTNAHLSEANLTGTYLNLAILIDAQLIQANLTSAYLWKANLTGAYLIEAKIMNTILSEANLEGANLKGANLTGTILRQADLKHATLPDGTQWQPHMDIEYLRRFTDPKHPDFKHYPTIWDAREGNEE